MTTVVQNSSGIPLSTPLTPKTGPSYGGSGGVAYPAQPSQSSTDNTGWYIGLGTVAGAVAIGVGISHYMRSRSTPQSYEPSTPGPAGGRRHSRRKHHAKNKTRRA